MVPILKSSSTFFEFWSTQWKLRSIIAASKMLSRPFVSIRMKNSTFRKWNSRQTKSNLWLMPCRAKVSTRLCATSTRTFVIFYLRVENFYNFFGIALNHFEADFLSTVKFHTRAEFYWESGEISVFSFWTHLNSWTRAFTAIFDRIRFSIIFFSYESC